MALNRMGPACHWAVLLARGWHRPDPAGSLAVALQQRQAHFVAHRKHNHYFVPDDPDVYERAKQAWTSPRPSRLLTPQTRPPMPKYAVAWPEGHEELLLTAAGQAGLSERTAKRVVRAASRGRAPDEPVLLSERIKALKELQEDLSSLDVERMLSLSTVAIYLPKHTVKSRVHYLSKLFPGRNIGQLLTGGSSWALRAPRELMSRLEGLESLWQNKLGQQLPKAHLSNARGLQRMVHGSTIRTARHMDTMLASHSQATCAQLYSKCPALLSYRPGVLNRKVAALRRTLGVDREAIRQLVEKEPGLLKANAVNLRNRVAGLEAILGPAFEAQATAAAAAAEEAAVAGGQGGLQSGAEQDHVFGDSAEAWDDDAHAVAAAAARAAVQRQPSLLKYRKSHFSEIGAVDRNGKPLPTFANKVSNLRKALDLTQAQVASMVAAHPALLTRSMDALRKTGVALASMPQGSALGLDGKAVSEVVLAAPAALGLSAQAAEARMQALAALAGLGPAWMGHMCDLAADRAALGAALTQRNGRYERLRWLVGGRQQGEPVPGALELLRMEEGAFRELHPEYTGDGPGS